MSARIVVVGGSAEDHLTLVTQLRGAGYPDVRFVTAAEAIAACGTRAVDVVLVDVMQSSADVLAVIKACAGRDTGLPTPVLVTAPVAASDRVAACLQRGAEDFLTTPFDSAQPLLVTRRVELAVQRKRLHELTAVRQAEAAGRDPNETAVLKLYRDASSRFVPREFLDNLDKRTILEIKLGDHVQREMTVFFSDIRDFTALSERMTPQQNFDFLNSYLKYVTPIIRANHGFIDKYIGDAIMALFPRAGSDALHASLALEREVVRYNQERRLAGYEPIRIGIGMHRGDLILGTIGEDERMQTTVIADAVNVASRIEGLTKTFGVELLVSGNVVETFGTGDGFKLRHLGAVKAKGKTQSVEIYECYDNDPADLIAHKDKTAEAFVAAMNEFRKGMFLTAGRIFSRIAELHPEDRPAAYYRDRCSLTAVRGRGPGPWDGAEMIEAK